MIWTTEVDGAMRNKKDKYSKIQDGSWRLSNMFKKDICVAPLIASIIHNGVRRKRIDSFVAEMQATTITGFRVYRRQQKRIYRLSSTRDCKRSLQHSHTVVLLRCYNYSYYSLVKHI